MKTYELGKKEITIEDVYGVAKRHIPVRLSAEAKTRIARAHTFLIKKAKSGETIYGVNTGFGILSNVKIEDQDLDQLQLNLLRSHAVGTGRSTAQAHSTGRERSDSN